MKLYRAGDSVWRTVAVYTLAALAVLAGVATIMGVFKSGPVHAWLPGLGVVLAVSAAVVRVAEAKGKDLKSS